MKRAIAAAILASLSFASAAQSTTDETRWGRSGPGTLATLERHHQMMTGIPAPYAKMRDRSTDVQGKLALGTALFDEHCSACHGLSGRGNGTSAQLLYPHPADLSWLARIPVREAERYMYWTIAEGGQQFGSDMPAFKSRLARDDIWAVIAYVRSSPRTVVRVRPASYLAD